MGEGAADSRDLQGIPYVIPSMEYVTEELTELILRRYLGLPWLIDADRATGTSVNL